MDSNFTHYILVLLAVVIGVVIIKKVTSCLFRIITLAVLVAALAYIYLNYLQ